MNEYILVFSKPGPKAYHGREAQEQEAARYPVSRLFTLELANNIWHIAPIPPGVIDHPAPFPEEIPYRLISLYSYPGDLVLDPFAGSGQVLKVAKALGRNYAGYEIFPQYRELAERRLDEPLNLRPQQLYAVFEKVELEEPLDRALNRKES